MIPLLNVIEWYIWILAWYLHIFQNHLIDNMGISTLLELFTLGKIFELFTLGNRPPML